MSTTESGRDGNFEVRSGNVNSGHLSGVLHAFLLTQGFPPRVRKNVVLAELDIAYIQNVIPGVTPIPEVEVKMEPMVLQAALRHVREAYTDFFKDLLALREGDDAAMGKAFEFVVGNLLLPKLIPTKLDAGLGSATWRRYVGEDPKPSDAELNAAVARFAHEWEWDASSFGRVSAVATEAAEAFAWLRHHQVIAANKRSAAPPAVLPAVLYPDNKAGPDVMLVARRRRDQRAQVRAEKDDVAHMLVLVQAKFAKGRLDGGGLDGTQSNAALVTVDPSKFYAENRGRADETLLHPVETASLVKSLANVAVVRVVVSGAAEVLRIATGLVRNGRGGFDLQVGVGRAQLETWVGRDVVEGACLM